MTVGRRRAFPFFPGLPAITAQSRQSGPRLIWRALCGLVFLGRFFDTFAKLETDKTNQLDRRSSARMIGARPSGHGDGGCDTRCGDRGCAMCWRVACDVPLPLRSVRSPARQGSAAERPGYFDPHDSSAWYRRARRTRGRRCRARQSTKEPCRSSTEKPRARGPAVRERAG